MKRIKHVSELPKWFQREKYRAAENLDAAGWSEQLNLRVNFWLSDPMSLDEKSREVLELIRATPIADVAGNRVLSAYLATPSLSSFLWGVKGRPPYRRGVYLLTLGDLAKIERRLGNDELGRTDAERFIKWEQKRRRQDDEPKALYADWLDVPVYYISGGLPSVATVNVNLLLPDKLLIEHFTRWLADLRAESLKRVRPVVRRVYRQPDFLAWAKFGVLPYIDLTIWARERGVQIPNRVMADAIFSPGEGGEEVVRKTTAKLARALLRSKRLAALEAHAAHEEIPELYSG